MPHALLDQTTLQKNSYADKALQAENSAYAKLFPWTCLGMAIATGAPVLLLDTNSSIYSTNIAIANGFTALLSIIFGLVALRFLSRDPQYQAKGQILLGGILLGCLAVGNAMLLIDTADPRHAVAGVMSMICAALIYPRAIGVLLVSVPQLAVVTVMSQQHAWQDGWPFCFFTTLGAALIAVFAFYLRQAYFRRHQALLAERASFINALKTESVERTLLQESMLTERNLATLGRLAGGIAHDLNNILVPILGNAAMLEESLNSSTHKRQAREVMRAATRARNLTKQLGFFSARGNAEFETLELNQLLTELCPIVWRTFPQGVDINLEVTQPPIYLRVNRVILQDLITNLLLDAGNAATAGTCVNVNIALRAALPPQFLPPPHRVFCVVAISDGAETMTEKQRAALFQPDKLGNRGIGLLSARATAEAQGAFLDVDSAPDGGNQFCLFLPVQTEESETFVEDTPNIRAAVAPEVLVVDDEPSVRSVTAQLLKRAGFVVRECESGEAALGETKSHLPDAIVMDLRMPGMGGRAAAEKIRKSNPSLPIVICTGFTGDAEGWLSELPNCALLQKPYDKSDLIGAVNDLLGSELAAG